MARLIPASSQTLEFHGLPRAGPERHSFRPQEGDGLAGVSLVILILQEPLSFRVTQHVCVPTAKENVPGPGLWSRSFKERQRLKAHEDN